MKRFLKELGKFILVGLLVTLIVIITILCKIKVFSDIIILLIVCGGLFIGALKHKIKKSWCVYTCIWTLLLVLITIGANLLSQAVSQEAYCEMEKYKNSPVNKPDMDAYNLLKKELFVDMEGNPISGDVVFKMGADTEYAKGNAGYIADCRISTHTDAQINLTIRCENDNMFVLHEFYKDGQPVRELIATAHTMRSKLYYPDGTLKVLTWVNPGIAVMQVYNNQGKNVLTINARDTIIDRFVFLPGVEPRYTCLLPNGQKGSISDADRQKMWHELDRMLGAGTGKPDINYEPNIPCR